MKLAGQDRNYHRRSFEAHASAEIVDFLGVVAMMCLVESEKRCVPETSWKVSIEP
jgi:hypothetical protein